MHEITGIVCQKILGNGIVHAAQSVRRRDLLLSLSDWTGSSRSSFFICFKNSPLKIRQFLHLDQGCPPWMLRQLLINEGAGACDGSPPGVFVPLSSIATGATLCLHK
jgi:hypothetical protein